MVHTPCSDGRVVASEERQPLQGVPLARLPIKLAIVLSCDALPRPPCTLIGNYARKTATLDLKADAPPYPVYHRPCRSSLRQQRGKRWTTGFMNCPWRRWHFWSSASPICLRSRSMPALDGLPGADSPNRSRPSRR